MAVQHPSPLAAAACGLLVAIASAAPTIDQYAPVPPFPRSSLADVVAVSRVSIGPLPAKTSGDTWPSAWTLGDSMVAVGCDIKLVKGGPKIGIEVFGVAGSPQDPRSLTLELKGSPVPNSFCERNASADGRFPGTKNVKVAGMVAAGGALYLGAQCQNYGDNYGFNRQHNVDGWLLRSTDGGTSWKNGTAVSSLPTVQYTCAQAIAAAT